MIQDSMVTREKQLLKDFAFMMSEFVENWPEHNKIETSFALFAKILRASRSEVRILKIQVEEAKIETAAADLDLFKLQELSRALLRACEGLPEDSRSLIAKEFERLLEALPAAPTDEEPKQVENAK